MAWFRRRRTRPLDEAHHVASIEIGGTYRDRKGKSVSILSGPSKTGRCLGVAEDGWFQTYYDRSGVSLDGKDWRDLHWWSRTGPTKDQKRRLLKEGLFIEPFKSDLPSGRTVRTIWHDQ